MLGYHHVTSGLGRSARDLADALEAAGCLVNRLDVTTTISPARHQPRPRPDVIHPTTLAVVTATETPRVLGDWPELTGPGQRVIGVWYWELEEIPPSHRAGIELVDEIWAPTQFVHDAYLGCGAPVRLVPPPLPPSPEPTGDRAEWRRRLGLPTDVFLAVNSFDLFSVIERKNPVGLITAFERAFPDRDDVALVLKVLNADRRPDDLELVQKRLEGDPRVHLVADHLNDDAQHALIWSADCMVSLHRSEGLGLALIEAMWLGTPVIATRYGGNTDFMDDACAALVQPRPHYVTCGQGAYPDDSRWADPDLDQAARWIRQFYLDPSSARRLADRARERMQRYPSAARVGQLCLDALTASDLGSQRWRDNQATR